MNKVLKWILYILLGLVVVAVVVGASMAMIGFGRFGGGYWMMNHMRGFGYFNPVGMIFSWLFGLGVLVLVIVGIVALVNSLTRGNRTTQPTPPATPATPSRTCANCGKPAQDDWTTCPYCGHSLT